MSASESRFIFRGPIDLDTGEVADYEVPLLGVESVRLSGQTQTNKEPLYGQDADDTFLTPLSGQKSIQISGSVGFSRMAELNPTLPRVDAVRKYILQIEALVLAQQGIGWEIDDQVRNRIFAGTNPTGEDFAGGFLVEASSWTYDTANNERLTYTINAKFGAGVQDTTNPEAYISEYLNSLNPGDIEDKIEIVSIVGLNDPLQVDTYTFSEVSNRRFKRKVNVINTDIIHNTELPVVATLESGVDATYVFSGVVYETDTQAFEETIREFDEDIQGKTAIVTDALVGRQLSGTIGNSTTTIEASRPNRFTFDIEMDIGANIFIT